MSESSSTGTEWVFGVPHPGDIELIVLPRETAEALAALYDVVYGEATTVGDFAARCAAAAKTHPLTAGWLLDFDEWVEEDVDTDPNRPFVLDEVSGVGDGLFPPRVQTAMLDAWAGIDEFDEIGIVHDEMGGMPLLELHVNDLPAIKAAADAAGLVLTEEPDLIARLR